MIRQLNLVVKIQFIKAAAVSGVLHDTAFSDRSITESIFRNGYHVGAAKPNGWFVLLSKEPTG